MGVKQDNKLYMEELTKRGLTKIAELRAGMPKIYNGRNEVPGSVNWIAKRTGKSRNTLVEYFTGDRKIPQAALDLILASLQVDMLDLLSPSEIAEAYNRLDKIGRLRARNAMMETEPARVPGVHPVKASAALKARRKKTLDAASV